MCGEVGVGRCVWKGRCGEVGVGVSVVRWLLMRSCGCGGCRCGEVGVVVVVRWVLVWVLVWWVWVVDLVWGGGVWV